MEGVSEHLNLIKVFPKITILLVGLIWGTLSQDVQDQPQQGESYNENSNPNPQWKPSVFVHYAYSPLHLTYLSKLEKQIYETLGDYESELLKRLDIIRGYRQDYEDSVHRTLPNIDPTADDWHRASFLTSHPFLVHRMIRRYNIYLRDFYTHISKTLETRVWELFENLRGDYHWPTSNDLSDTMQMLLRLQETYDFDAEEFSSGIINGLETSAALSASNCLDIVDVALENGKTLAAGEWLKAAWQKVTVQEDVTASLDVFSDYWEKTTRMHGKTWNIDDFSTTDVFQEARSALLLAYEDTKFERSFDNRLNNFKALCRGEELLTPAELAKLYCYFESKKNPRFIIDPQRVEIHNLNPRLIEVHDFFGDQIIRDFSSKSLSPLMKAGEQGTAKPIGFLEAKTTAPAWIYDPTDEMVRLGRKVELFLGLNILTPGGSEPFHVAGFSVGGHYDPCVDCEAWENVQFRQELGERMTTVQLMLEEVESGGETVFTKLGVTITPKPGSILVYHNTLRNGALDPEMLHGSCPVLLGHKWIASIFIHENVNFLKRKCSKNDLK